MKNKLEQRAGETLIESLVALLIVSLAFVMLAGALMAAGRVERAAGETGAFASKPAAVTEVRVAGDTVTVRLAPPKDGSLYYYEYE